MKGLFVSLLSFVLLINQGSAAHCEFKNVAGSSWQTCALDTNREVVCWGKAFNQEHLAPPEGVQYNMIDCGHVTCCGVTTDTEIKCWGGNTDPNYRNMITSLVPTGHGFVSVDVGVHITCAMREDGSFTCWSNIAADLNGMPTGTSFVDVSATHSGACAVTTSGAITCWGDHHSHSTGINLEGEFMEIDMGRATGMALRKDGTVHMWGRDDYNVVSGKPANLANVKTISHNYYNPCAVLEDDTVQCWGYNNKEQINIPSGTKVKQIYSNLDVCYMTFEDEIVCRGDNTEGELNVPTDKQWNGSSNCDVSVYILVGTGICPGNKQTGELVEVASVEACRSRCNINFHETYFTVWDEDGAMQCKCFLDCDERTTEEKYKSYEILSVTVSNLLAEIEITIDTCDSNLISKTSSLENMTTERDLWQDRFEKSEEIEQARAEHASYRARQAFPDPDPEVGVAGGMTSGSNGSSFMEKATYMLIGSIVGTLSMFLAMKNQKVATEERELLLEA